MLSYALVTDTLVLNYPETPPEKSRLARHELQVPKISSVWETSAKPCSSAIACVHRSTAGPSTSTVAPHERHTRWWWWAAEQRR